MIPDFDERGLLPPGDHEATFEELRRSVVVEGPPDRDRSDWDAAWRRHLTHQAEKLARQLWHAGITEIYLDGSYVEDKPHPNDIDGYFLCDFRDFVSRRLERRLNDLDPHGIWTWDPATLSGICQAPTPNVARVPRRALPPLRGRPAYGDPPPGWLRPPLPGGLPPPARHG